MCIDDGAANRQPHAHAGFLGGEESFKNLFRILHPYAAIPYFDQNGFWTVSFRTDEECPGTINDRVHRLGPIQKQVEKKLLQLYAITYYGRKVIGKVRLDGNAPSRGLTIQQVEHLRNHFVQAEVDCLEGNTLEQSPNPPHHFSGFFAVANNSLGGLVRFIQTGGLGRKPAQAGVTICHDCRKRLVDFMRDGGRKFANSGGACRSRKLRLDVSKFLLNPLPILDIRACPVLPEDLPGGVAKG
jgi:hypothetical protein